LGQCLKGRGAYGQLSWPPCLVSWVYHSSLRLHLFFAGHLCLQLLVSSLGVFGGVWMRRGRLNLERRRRAQELLGFPAWLVPSRHLPSWPRAMLCEWGWDLLQFEGEHLVGTLALSWLWLVPLASHKVLCVITCAASSPSTPRLLLWLKTASITLVTGPHLDWWTAHSWLCT